MRKWESSNYWGHGYMLWSTKCLCACIWGWNCHALGHFIVGGEWWWLFFFFVLFGNVFLIFVEEIIIIFAWLCPFLPINFRLLLIKEISLCGLCYVAFRISGPFVHMSTVDWIDYLWSLFEVETKRPHNFYACCLFLV